MSSIKRIDLLVISVACHSSINRKIYKLFVDEGYAVEILLPKSIKLSGGEYNSDTRQSDDPMIITETLIGSNSRFQYFENQFYWLQKKKPKTVLLDNDPISLNAVLLGVWCFFNKAKLCCISCENQPTGIYKNIRQRGLSSIINSLIKKIIFKCSVHLVETVFTINNSGTKIFKDLKFKNVYQMPLGFDPKIFHINKSARKSVRLKLEVNQFLVGFFGRITREKGVLVLLEALATIKDLDWLLLMDEFSHYKTDFNKDVDEYVERLGIENRILHANPSHSEMGKYINAVDLVVMPSVSTKKWVEQYGRIAAESMACGKLVIASNSGALPMLIKGHGIIFDEGNVKELADKIRGVITSEINIEGNLDPVDISNYALEELSIQRQKTIMQDHLFS